MLVPTQTHCDRRPQVLQWLSMSENKLFVTYKHRTIAGWELVDRSDTRAQCASYRVELSNARRGVTGNRTVQECLQSPVEEPYIQEYMQLVRVETYPVSGFPSFDASTASSASRSSLLFGAGFTACLSGRYANKP